MTIPEWLRNQRINAQFRPPQEDWQQIHIFLDETGGKYASLEGDEEGMLNCLAQGQHPEGGTVVVLHWQEIKGPFAGHTGIDTLWFQQQPGAIAVRGTFFANGSNDYGEIKTCDEAAMEVMVG